MKLGILLLALFVSGLVLACYIGYVFGYKDGWTASFIDSIAVGDFYKQADELFDDSNTDSLDLIWQQNIITATQLETEWNALGLRKWNHPTSPFWKRNAGQPRRLSGKLTND